MIKKVLKYTISIKILIILFVILYFSFEFVLSRIPQKAIEVNEPVYQIFIKSNGVHTDIVLPIYSDTISWTNMFPFENTLAKEKDFNYISVGWGDKGFYLDTPEWKDLKVSTALIAGTGIGSTALHITYYKDVIEDELTYSYTISKEQYALIVSSIKKALQYKNGKPIYIETSSQYGQNDAFYEANGSYSIFHTCNTWTNNLLKEAGLPSAKWLAFDKGILNQYKKLRRNQ